MYFLALFSQNGSLNFNKAQSNLRREETTDADIKALENEVHAIADPDVQRHYKAILREKVSETFFARRQTFGARGKNKPSALKVRRPVFNQLALYPKIFLSALINHPRIYESMEEVVGQMALRSKVLDNVRQEIVKLLIENPDLDSAALKDHLIAAGFEQEIGDILSESVYVHAAFCAPSFDSGLVEGRLQEWLNEVGERDWTEITEGWKEALYNSSEDDEAKLREMIQAKVSDSS